jgi:hypothetical protein
VPAALLDRSPLPVSAPDERWLDGTVSSGLPLQIRLLIDAQGQVLSVTADEVQDIDQPWFQQVQAMLLATRFLPGQLHGMAVPTRLDLLMQSDPAPAEMPLAP